MIYWIIFIAFSLLASLVQWWIDSQQKKKLAETLQRLEKVINHNATVTDDNKAALAALALYIEHEDPEARLFLDAMKKLIAEHLANPKHYPYKPNEWITDYELMNLANQDTDG